MARVGRRGFQLEPRLRGESADRAAREQAEGRGTRGQATYVPKQRALDLLAALSGRVLQPGRDALVERRRGEEDGLAHDWIGDERAQAIALSGAVADQRLPDRVERAGRRRRRCEQVIPKGRQYGKRAQRRTQDEEVGRREAVLALTVLRHEPTIFRRR